MTAVVSESHWPDVEERQHWISPTDLIVRIGIHQGMTVADIGAGTGCFALPIARQVGPKGKVFAVDSRPEALERLRSRIRREDPLPNLELINGTAACTNLPDGCCDVVLLADLWHELEDCGSALDEARRLLREDGRLVILDWRPDAASPPGPPVSRRVSEKAAIYIPEMQSWSLVKCHEDEDGYLLVFVVTDESVQS